MNQKGLRSVLPNLARAYISAHNDNGIKVYVPKSYYVDFIVFEYLLKDIGVANRHYAQTVVTLLKGWCKNNKLKHIPINVFLGEWAFSRYLQVYYSESVDLTVGLSGELLHSELLVARLYIAEYSDNPDIKFGSIVKDVTPLLSKRWLELYNSRDTRPCRDEALAMLAKEFKVPSAKNYKEIANHAC